MTKATNEKVCAVFGFAADSVKTGTFDLKLPVTDRAALYEGLETLILRRGMGHFVCSTEPSALTASEILCELRDEKYPDVTVECVIPFENQTSDWSEDLRSLYFSVLESSDRETLIQRRFTPECGVKQAAYMAKGADLKVALLA